MNCYPTIDCPYKEDIEALAEEQVAERYDDYLQDVDVDADIHWQEHRLWVETDTPLMRETWILVGTTLTMLPTDDPDVPALAAAALAAAALAARALDSGSDPLSAATAAGLVHTIEYADDEAARRYALAQAA